MVTTSDVRRWDPRRLEDAFRSLGTARDQLVRLDDALAAARLPEAEWRGTAAELSRAAHNRIAGRLRTLSRAADVVHPGLAGAIDAVVALRADLTGLDGYAAANGFVIGDDGSVSDVRAAHGGAREAVAERAAESALLTERVRKLLERASAVDDTVHLLLRDAQPDPAPLAVAAWWNALPAVEQERFATDHPDEAGSLDGLPATTRDAANRHQLLTAIADAEARRAAVAHQLSVLSDAVAHGRQGMDQVPRRDALAAQLARADAQVMVLRGLQQRLQADDGRPLFLLEFQPAVDKGRAIVAVGNPDRSENVVTCVPGTSARLSTITAEVSRAETVADAAEAAAPAQSTAVIAWDAYDAPQSILPDAAQTRYADAAEPLLRSFQEGLRAAHTGPVSHNTVLGHSYGSTVIGHTARDGTLDADALVFAGSPGVGVNDVRGLHRPTGTVYSTTAAADPIEITHSRMLGPADDALGRDPSNPRFGAHVFLADPHGGHSDYWNPGNPSLRSFGLIATGQEPVP